ncbi:MAG: leucyl aminopeptidase family protein [Pseudomonadota bacterium]
MPEDTQAPAPETSDPPAEVPEPPALIDLDLVDKAALETYLTARPAPEAAWIRANGFKAAIGQHVAMPAPDGGIERMVVGHGSADDRRRARFALGAFAAKAPGGTYRLATPLPPEVAAEEALGWLLARYRFERYRTTGPSAEAELLVPDGVDGQRLGIVAEGVFLTRDLVNTPANDMGPAALEAAARTLAEDHGATVEVTTGEALLEANLPLIHTVGRASDQAPRLIDLTWGDPGHATVTLVGKGVCFDTGGLDLKPASAMKLMKKDMGGAAHVLGLAHMIMALHLPVRLRVLIPAVENAVSANSFRPGDILTARNGLTVEVNNTDAEGRLVLADALSLAAEDAPVLLADFATLTGAARVALGPEVAPFFTDDEDLATALATAGTAQADPVWRLPLWPGYEADIEPGIADLDNAPAGGLGGAITAALFLKRFTAGLPWVHFDVYAWTPKTKPGRPLGGEAQAARALLAVIEERFA